VSEKIIAVTQEEIMKGKINTNKKILITGGAGAGKSTVIHVLSQWLHRILQKPGDDPDSPYVIKTATTGNTSNKTYSIFIIFIQQVQPVC
jgi:GTPase SAR1 family protein